LTQEWCVGFYGQREDLENGDPEIRARNSSAKSLNRFPLLSPSTLARIGGMLHPPTWSTQPVFFQNIFPILHSLPRKHDDIVGLRSAVF
jgi:hypothetical protein